MEAKSTVRGKYKKHKEGFKIAVEYKLNTKLKGQSDEFDNHTLLYPVYIEVRAHRQMSFIRSFYAFYASPSNFKTFMTNDLVQSLVLQESEGIKSHMESYLRNHDKHGITLKDWLTEYRNDENNIDLSLELTRIFRIKVLGIVTQKEAISNAFSELLRPDDGIKPILSLALLLREILKTDELDEIVEALRAYLRLHEVFASCTRDWLSPSSGLLYLSVTKFTVLENIHIAKRLKDMYPENLLIFSDIDKLRKLFDEK
jgi:hypothetical protein